MKHQLLLFFFLFFGGGQAWVVNAQTTLAQETFEGVSTDYGYTASTIDPATVGFNPAIEYFERRMFTAVTGGIGYVGTTQGLNNRQGDYTWTGEGVRGTGQTNVRPAGTVTLNKIVNSQNYRSFVITVAFAAPRGGTFSGAGANTAYTTDRIRIQYSFDGGAWTTVAMLMGNSARDFQQLTTLSDSTSVANGSAPTGNGAVLDQTYRDITATLPSTALGANLQVRVVLDTKLVEVAFDNIRVTGVLDNTAKPTLTNVESTAVSYTEGGNPVPLTSSLAVGYSDNSATTLTGGVVTIGSFVTGQDVLNFTNQNGITGSYNTSTGALTLSGTATQAAYQTALRSITYSNSNTTTATGGARSVTFQVYNGATLSTTAGRTITVTSVLNPPAPLNYTENFDTDGEGTRYFGNQFANTSGEVGFFRATTAPATFNGSRIGEGVFTGWSGGYWFGEGNDNRNNLIAPNSTLQLAPVNASGRSTIKFTIALGAAGNWLGYFNAANPGDRFELYYSVNGADPVKFGAFYGVDGTAPARQDSDLDPLTPATGTPLTPALQEFTFDLPAAAAVGNLTFLLRQRTRGQSEIAFDNIRITGTAPPTVVTATPTSVSNTVATLGGSITSDGGATVTERGVVYSTTNANPTIGGTGTTQDGNASGSTSFTKAISGLSAGTRYYVAAYATNTAGTAYGNTLTFVTAPNAPVVNLPANNATVSTTPTYSGTSQTGSTVTVYVDGTALSGAATIDASGNWTKVQPSALSSGSHRVYATATVTVNSATSPSSATSNINTFSVDATGPSVTSVGVPTTGTYRAGQPLSFTVNFAENTIVSGVPQLGLTIGTSSRVASYSSGSGSTALVFIYSVQPGEQDIDGISLGALSLNGGSIRDGAGNNATLTLNNVGATAGVLVDAVAPGVSISSSAGTSGASTTTSPVPFAITFTESVTGLNGGKLSVSGGTLGDFSGSGTTYTFSVTPSGNGATISVNVGGGVAQDAAGNNNTAAGRSYSITYSATPTIAGFAADPASVCVGSPLTFTATVGNLSPPYAFTLSNGSSTTMGTAASTAFSQVLTASGSGLQTFTLTVSSDGQSVTATTSVTVNALPVAGLMANGPLSCSQTSVMLTASGGGTYRFSSGASQVNGGNTATVTQAGLYSVTVTSANGCSSVASTTVTGDQSVPTAGLTNNGPISCSTTSVTLTASGGSSYRFSSGVNQIGNGPTATVSTAGVYSVTVTSANGCTATASTSIGFTNNLVATAGASSSTAPVGSVVSLTASGGSSYGWLAPPGTLLSSPATSSLVSATLTTSGPKTFTVIVSQGSCSQSLTVEVTGVVLSDLTPVVYARPTLLYGTAPVTVVVDVVELNSVPTSGTLTVRLTKDTKVTLSFSPDATSVGGRGVQNSVWSFRGDDPNFYVLTTSQPVGAGDRLSLGLTGVLSPGATTGKLSISAILLATGMSEARTTNNADADKIEYFQQ